MERKLKYISAYTAEKTEQGIHICITDTEGNTERYTERDFVQGGTPEENADRAAGTAAEITGTTAHTFVYARGEEEENRFFTAEMQEIRIITDEGEDIRRNGALIITAGDRCFEWVLGIVNPDRIAEADRGACYIKTVRAFSSPSQARWLTGKMAGSIKIEFGGYPFAEEAAEIACRVLDSDGENELIPQGKGFAVRYRGVMYAVQEKRRSGRALDYIILSPIA